MRRAEMLMLLQRLQRLGLSKYEPSPERACEMVEQRREQEEPSSAA